VPGVTEAPKVVGDVTTVNPTLMVSNGARGVASAAAALASVLIAAVLVL
jgi:hypothetical protein